MQLMRRLGWTLLSLLSTSRARLEAATRTNTVTNCFTAILELSDCTANC